MKSTKQQENQPLTEDEFKTNHLIRLNVWHQNTRRTAAEFKFYAFLAGAEIMSIKAAMGVNENSGRPKDGDISFAQWIEEHAGISYSTANRYCNAYLNIMRRNLELDKLPQKILDAVDIYLKTGDATEKSLTDKASKAMQLMDHKRIEDFLTALDPWSLSELYERPIKTVAAQEKLEETKRKNEERERQLLMKFWFNDFRSRLQSHEHLHLGTQERQIILEDLEAAVRDIRASLKAENMHM